MRSFCVSLTTVAVVVLGATADADLKWDQTTIEVKTGPNDQMAVAHFKYQNTGTAPIRFKSVKPACGCTTVQTQQEQVLPGEKGEITARLNVGDRVGLQEKTVTVDTDEISHPATVLTIKTYIPQQLEIAPTFVFWQSGEPAKPKVITVKVSKEWAFPVRGVKVNTTSWDFQTKVERVSKDEFRVEVQPRDTSRSASAALSIEPEDSSRKFTVNARIMGSGSSSGTLSNGSGQSADVLMKNPFDDPAPGSSP